MVTIREPIDLNAMPNGYIRYLLSVRVARLPVSSSDEGYQGYQGLLLRNAPGCL